MTFKQQNTDLLLVKVVMVLQQVNCLGVDEWLMLCKKFKKLSDRFPDTWTPPGEEEQAEGDSKNGKHQQQGSSEEGGAELEQPARQQGKKRKQRKAQRRWQVESNGEEAEERDEEKLKDEEEEVEWEVLKVVNVRVVDNARRGTQGDCSP